MNDYYLVVRTDKGFLALADGYNRGWTNKLHGARLFSSREEAIDVLLNRGISINKRNSHIEIRPLEYYLGEPIDRETL